MVFLDQQLSIHTSRTIEKPPYNPFIVRYDTPTVPLPPHVYLKRNALERIHEAIQDNFWVPEITGNDGDGKSTMIHEVSRYLKDQGHSILLVDYRKVSGLIPTIQDFLASKSVQQSQAKAVVCIDSADELWLTHDKNWTYDRLQAEKFRLEMKGLKLPSNLSLLLIQLENQRDDIQYLQNISPRVGLVLTKHKATTPSTLNFKDNALRSEMVKLHLKQIDISFPYDEEDAERFLKHFGITNPLLIKAVISLYRRHGDLKKIACLRNSSGTKELTLQELFELGNVSDELRVELFIRSLPYWLKLANRSIGEK